MEKSCEIIILLFILIFLNELNFLLGFPFFLANLNPHFIYLYIDLYLFVFGYFQPSTAKPSSNQSKSCRSAARGHRPHQPQGT